MDLEARLAALEAEVSRLKASQGVVTAPFRVQSPEGKTLVEIGVNYDGRAEIRLFDLQGVAIIKLFSEKGGSALLMYAEGNVSNMALRSDERGSE